VNEGYGESKWPYDKPFYLIMNVAVGGEWGRIKGIDDEAFPQTMEIDYVRIYQVKD
jgi:beta-glucanase (GH16 family)